MAGYLPEPSDEGARLVGRALALSLLALAADPRELPRQIFGRLGGVAHPVAAALAAAARQDPEFRLAPRWPGLTPPGAKRLRLVGHEGVVESAAFSPDGARLLTASADCTARLWDAATGAELARVVLDAAVSALAVHGGSFTLGDALGRVHVFDAQEFLSGKGGSA